MTGPRRLRIATAMALSALGAVVTVIPLHAQSLATPEQRELAQARENAKWEQAIGAKRLAAFLRDAVAWKRMSGRAARHAASKSTGGQAAA